MAHQMKNLCGFSVFHCVEGAFGASSRGTPKMKMGPREMNSKMVVVVVQNVEEKSAEMGAKMDAKMGTKICAPKICAKMGAKICAPKMGAKMGAPKICAKNRFEHSICLEDGSQKKKHKKDLRQTCAKHQSQLNCGKTLLTESVN